MPLVLSTQSYHLLDECNTASAAGDLQDKRAYAHCVLHTQRFCSWGTCCTGTKCVRAQSVLLFGYARCCYDNKDRKATCSEAGQIKHKINSVNFLDEFFRPWIIFLETSYTMGPTFLVHVGWFATGASVHHYRTVQVKAPLPGEIQKLCTWVIYVTCVTILTQTNFV